MFSRPLHKDPVKGEEFYYNADFSERLRNKSIMTALKWRKLSFNKWCEKSSAGSWNPHPNRLPKNFTFSKDLASSKEHGTLVGNPNFHNFWGESLLVLCWSKCFLQNVVTLKSMNFSSFLLFIYRFVRVKKN